MLWLPRPALPTLIRGVNPSKELVCGIPPLVAAVGSCLSASCAGSRQGCVVQYSFALASSVHLSSLTKTESGEPNSQERPLGNLKRRPLNPAVSWPLKCRKRKKKMEVAFTWPEKPSYLPRLPGGKKKSYNHAKWLSSISGCIVLVLPRGKNSVWFV